MSRKLNLEIEPYFALLLKHDWHYDMSDDHEKWKAGSASLRVLTELAATHEIYGQMFDDFREHYFSGQPWGTDKKPMPEVETYLKKAGVK